MPITLPNVSTGGTHVDVLLAQQSKLKESLEVALEALKECEPHFRDYLDYSTFVIARSDHIDNLSGLEILLGRVNQTIEHITNQYKP